MSCFRHRLCLLSLVLLTPVLPGGAARAASGAEERKQALWGEGQAALEDHLYAIAERKFEQYLRLAATREERAQGALHLARAYVGLKRYAEAAELLGGRRSSAAGTPSADGFDFWLALSQFEAGKWDAAGDRLEDFDRRHPESAYRAQAARLRARCLLKLGRADKALEILARAGEELAEQPGAPDVLLDWGAALAEQGRTNEAERVMARLVERHPEHEAAAPARLWLAGVYAGRGEWEAVRGLLDPLARQAAGSPRERASAWFAMAALYEAQTNLASAIEALSGAARVAPDPGERLRSDVLRGRLLVRSGRVDEGVQLLRGSVRALGRGPEAGRAQLELAQALLDQQRWAEADDEFQRYLDTFTDGQGLARALEGRGWSLWNLRRHAESAAAFDKAFGLYTNRSDRARALLKSGDALFASGRYALAQEKYRLLLRDFPGDPLRPQATYQDAECLARRNDRGAAESVFRALADTQPGSPLGSQSLLRIAELREAAGAWESARSAYEEALQSCSNRALCARAWMGHGLAHYRLGRLEDALDDFLKVSGDFPESEAAEQALYMRGWCLHRLGRTEDALALGRQFVDKYTNSVWAPEAIFWMGEHHFNEGGYAQAEREFSGLSQRFLRSELADDALFWAGQAAARQKEFLRAIDYCNRLAKQYPDSPRVPEARFAQGDALSEFGEFAGAILAFEEIIRKYPNTHLADLAWGRKGDCRFALGSGDPARYPQAYVAYQIVLNSPRAGPDLRQQAEYKMGRCREKEGRKTDALEHYMNVVYGFPQDGGRGVGGSSVWFTRAAFAAAALQEGDQKWLEALNIYRRVVAAEVASAPEAQERINTLRQEHPEIL
jgi:TolA-binding protein